jgi:hypothetical protein
MASTFKSVTDTMSDMNIVTWTVKGPKGNQLGYQRNNNMDINMSIAQLRKVVEGQIDDFVRVELDPPPGGKGGNLKKMIKIDVDLSTVNSKVSGIGQIMPTHDFTRLEKMISELSQQNQALTAKLIESKYENKIKELEQQINGVGNDDPIGRVIDLVIPILSAYIPKMMNQDTNPPAINGVPDPMERLLAVDPEGMKVVEAIANLAEKNPSMYNQYKPILLNL